MERILEIFGEPIVNGGQESYILNMFENMEHDKIAFDVYTPFSLENMEFKSKIEEYGGTVKASGTDFVHNRNMNLKKCLKQEINNYLDNYDYKIAHIHSGSIRSLMTASKIARESGIEHVIIHSHCGGFNNMKYRIIKTISVLYFNKYPTEFCACSNLAAKWKFPKSIIREKKYRVLKNAVDVNMFYYSEEIRKQMRKKLGISEDKLVIGNVGRFSIQKNHNFLIDIFKNIHELNPNSCLILVGNGELKNEILEKIENLGLADAVKYLGIRSDVNDIMNAMDVFVLPSFFEGLPVVGVEAEATGLPVVTSTGVTQELPIKDLSFYFSLKNMSADAWAEKIIGISNKTKRHNTTNEIIASGYSVKEAAKVMQDFYFSLIEEKNNERV